MDLILVRSPQVTALRSLQRQRARVEHTCNIHTCNIHTCNIHKDMDLLSLLIEGYGSEQTEPYIRTSDEDVPM